MALVRLDGFYEIGRSAIVQEEDALSHTPQRSGPELIAGRVALRNVIGETAAHIVNKEVGERVNWHVHFLRDE